MYLKKDELKIRNAEAKDAPQLALWWNDGAVMAHAGFPNGLGKSAESIVEDLKTDSDDTHRRLIIEHDGTSIGEMCYHRESDTTAEIGIKICELSMQNKGIGKKVLSMLISSLFDDMGYSRIILDTNLNNKRAQHVYETIGFVKTKIKYDSWKDQLGNLQSAVCYELYKENFKNFAE